MCIGKGVATIYLTAIRSLSRGHERGGVFMTGDRIVLPLRILLLVFAILIGGHAAWAQSAQEAQGPTQGIQGTQPSLLPTPSVVDPSADLDKRLSILEEWKAKIERFP